MEKFIEYLEIAEKKIQTADHMAYVTFPLINDKRLLFKILMEISSAILNAINSILQYEYLYKRINLVKDAKTNFMMFKENCALRYNISSDEINSILELIHLVEQHKQSPFEFIKDDKIVIMSENLKTEIITLEKIKKFLIVGKNIIKKARDKYEKSLRKI